MYRVLLVVSLLLVSGCSFLGAGGQSGTPDQPSPEVTAAATPSTTPTHQPTSGDGRQSTTTTQRPTATPSPTAVPDSDGDGLGDARERELGTDPERADTDDDGLNDSRELAVGTDPARADTDGDGLADGAEVLEYGTNATVVDTDGDGLTDRAEVEDHGSDPLAVHSDGDGLNDTAEIRVHETDPAVADTDDDRLNDSAELDRGTDPTAADTDGDGLDDYREVNIHETDPLAADTDGDGLNDSRELGMGLDPTAVDTDGDTINDTVELRRYDTDPGDAHSDGDTLNDSAEIEIYGTAPTHQDTDGDGLPDGVEVNMTDRFPDADPLEKDIFLELDYRTKLDDHDVEAMKERFRDAPVNTTTGVEEIFENGTVDESKVRDGIDLHVYFDDELECDGTTEPPQEVPGTIDRACSGGGHDNVGYYYGRIVEEVNIPDNGMEEAGFATSDSFYAADQSRSDVTTPVVMHELGHVLGIYAAGVDSHEFDHDEYPSVMNYNAPATFLGYSDGTNGDDDHDDWAEIGAGLAYQPYTDPYQVRDQTDERE
ncbi:hypothetical protein [Halosimplex pelagicum]|uniref:Thrombospondin type 3 repeat-containing protein n=1 Tax=Halosimplex pelagicum TaxID=869886 RepID=A0A7D5TGK1_9EURY|nr:hypothetical protein [Halosimplex pelagicum]QLH81696.1 hypothetical protein HZS54_08680 [Halosimplex pelagicum]